MVELFANSGDPDQMLCSAVSDLGLHYLPVTHLGVSSLKWVDFRIKFCGLQIFWAFASYKYINRILCLT